MEVDDLVKAQCSCGELDAAAMFGGMIQHDDSCAVIVEWRSLSEEEKDRRRQLGWRWRKEEKAIGKYSGEQIESLVKFIGELVTLGIWWSDALVIGTHYHKMTFENSKDADKLLEMVNEYTSGKVLEPIQAQPIW